MEQVTSNQPQTIVIKTGKSVALAIVLSFFFGPLGMLYSTITGAIVMFVINGFAFFLTAGIGLLFTWPIGVIWAAVAANNHNKRLGL